MQSQNHPDLTLSLAGRSSADGTSFWPTPAVRACLVLGAQRPSGGVWGCSVFVEPQPTEPGVRCLGRTAIRTAASLGGQGVAARVQALGDRPARRAGA